MYWSKVRRPDQPFTEIDPVYGKVYHTGNAEDVQQMMDAEGACWYHAHPRTKGTTGPEDDTYANFPVNYLKLEKVPGPDDDQTPVMKALRDGQYFVTTGEILIKSYAVEGTAAKRTISADLEWTYPLAFVEVVWGDGQKIDRQIIPATDSSAFGSKKLSIPFDATGKAWVRFAVWDTAGNGAFVQPIWLRGARATNEQ